ncbi:hypothetical protein CONCODRAFT_9533, partial [Conidiobolus coronatus NRRL 28638]
NSNPLNNILNSNYIHPQSLSKKLGSNINEVIKLLEYIKLPEDTSLGFTIKTYNELQFNEGKLASYILTSSRRDVLPWSKIIGSDSSLYIKDKVIRRSVIAYRCNSLLFNIKCICDIDSNINRKHLSASKDCFNLYDDVPLAIQQQFALDLIEYPYLVNSNYGLLDCILNLK